MKLQREITTEELDAYLDHAVARRISLDPGFASDLKLRYLESWMARMLNENKKEAASFMGELQSITKPTPPEL